MADETNISNGFASRTVLVKNKDGVVAGVRTKTITFEGEPIDTTSDENNGWRNLIATYGTRGMTISVEGVVKSHSLKTAALSQAVMNDISMEWPDGYLVQGDFAMANYTETGSFDGEMTFSCEFRSTGPITYTSPVAPVPGKPIGLIIDGGAGGLSTVNKKPTFIAYITPNNAATIYNGADVLASGTANNSGRFSYTPPSNMAAGTYNLTVTDTSSNGESPKSDVSILVIEASPLIPGALTVAGVPSGGTTTQGFHDVTGNSDPNSLVTLYDDTTVLGYTKADGSGSYIFHYYFVEKLGQYQLAVTSTINGEESAMTVPVYTIAVTA